ncbi:uncharacterized protein ACLA_035250 [Aspergillus clavatus NRRL 1]|uniref:Uncharacterized protein n=1 Tax=Aspergillus clavatus (strain ATCC 1007 / CBS 513.65 / DSM 816 / NCTC 3887 / NRRL 1 / QM 1276 / 107) TaxID=344612 RepID=A1CJJ8_ASPCL|nr:uncharacterized protein ACLA_035250 [Aspergillus clavatus NRRL 1]EAW09322.1 hypothetical protein ACLA_035250 [Aspergillus clavatus NRRL 1]
MDRPDDVVIQRPTWRWLNVRLANEEIYKVYPEVLDTRINSRRVAHQTPTVSGMIFHPKQPAIKVISSSEMDRGGYLQNPCFGSRCELARERKESSLESQGAAKSLRVCPAASANDDDE